METQQIALPARLRGCWWNVWQNARNRTDGVQAIAARATELIEQHQLDWLCLQEAYVYGADGKQCDLAETIHQQTGWPYVFTPGTTYYYDGRHETVRRQPNYSEGIATFTRLPILQHRNVVLGARPHRSGTTSNRYVLEVLLDGPAPFAVCNTHWSYMSWHNRTYRRNEMLAFDRYISGLNPDTAYAIGGDFNTFSFHPIIRHLRHTLDLHTGTPLRPTWLYDGKRRRILRSNIDYVGVVRGGKLQLKDFAVLTEARSPSDHAPLYAEFALTV